MVGLLVLRSKNDLNPAAPNRRANMVYSRHLSGAWNRFGLFCQICEDSFEPLANVVGNSF